MGKEKSDGFLRGTWVRTTEGMVLKSMLSCRESAPEHTTFVSMASAMAAFQRTDSLTNMQWKDNLKMNQSDGYMKVDAARRRYLSEKMGEVYHTAPILYNGGEKFDVEDIILGKERF